MPSNVAHMLIAHKALERLSQKGTPEYAEFADMLNDNSKKRTNFKAYFNLGSLGPDLFYYTKLGKSVMNILKDGYIRAIGVVPWSYNLHSQTPNVYPLNLCKILFRDAIRDKGKVVLENDDKRKLAYIAGHLSHIAADQIIHPLVNKVSQPYFREGKNRIKHRKCEVYQDYFLYERVYRLEGKPDTPRYQFFEQDFRGWVDCIKGRTIRNTKNWFRYFLQRGFIESYGISPDEDDIEDSVDNLLLTLWASKTAGPYKEAAREIEKHGDESKKVQEFIKKPRYTWYYREAVELSMVYFMALYEVYYVLKRSHDFTDKHTQRFLAIVRPADLCAPLEKDILDKAIRALKKATYMAEDIKPNIPKLVDQIPFLSTKKIKAMRKEQNVVQT